MMSLCSKVRTKDHVFDNVGHLIKYHMDNSLPIISSGSEVSLKQPVKKHNNPGLSHSKKWWLWAPCQSDQKPIPFVSGGVTIQTFSTHEVEHKLWNMSFLDHHGPRSFIKQRSNRLSSEYEILRRGILGHLTHMHGGHFLKVTWHWGKAEKHNYNFTC